MGGDQFSCGGRSFETHTAPDLIFSILRRSLAAPPLRKPRRVDDAAPYVLRELAAVPVLVDTVLELRALRTLLVLLTAEGIAGTGAGNRDDGAPDEAYSEGRTDDECCRNGAV